MAEHHSHLVSHFSLYLSGHSFSVMHAWTSNLRRCAWQFCLAVEKDELCQGSNKMQVGLIFASILTPTGARGILLQRYARLTGVWVRLALCVLLPVCLLAHVTSKGSIALTLKYFFNSGIFGHFCMFYILFTSQSRYSSVRVNEQYI